MDGKRKYHKVTPEEHRKILASRHSVLPVAYSKISEKTGVSVRTVRRYAEKPPAVSKEKRIRASMFDAYKDEIETMLNRNMGKQSYNVKACMRDFRAAHQELQFGKTSFYDYVKYKCKLTQEPKLASIPLEHEWGEAQIDFCTATYYRGLRKVDGYQFTMTFPKSDVSFVQCFPAQNQQCLFDGMKNIFEYVGAVPKSILFDNASTAVLTLGGKGKDAVPTEDYANFAAWYGFEYKFCNPARGNEKGSVEHANSTKRKAYFTPYPHIHDEKDFNAELLKRCIEDAKEKHYLKGIPKIDLFENDKKASIPIPKTPYDTRKSERHTANKCAIVQVQNCRYSVSDRHNRRNVIVRYGAFDVDIYEMTGEHICHHRRSYQKGSITIDPTMYAEALAARPRANIKKSENEYTDLAMYPDAENGYGETQNAEILKGIQDTLESVRPAARDDAFSDFCDSQGITYSKVQCKTNEAMILLQISSYNDDKERYDKIIQSNSHVVQKAETGPAICRGRTE